jgi:hypothetical protein
MPLKYAAALADATAIATEEVESVLDTVAA